MGFAKRDRDRWQQLALALEQQLRDAEEALGAADELARAAEPFIPPPFLNELLARRENQAWSESETELEKALAAYRSTRQPTPEQGNDD